MLILALSSPADASFLARSKADAFEVGLKDFSSRSGWDPGVDEAAEFIALCHASHKKVYFNLQRMVEQSFLEQARDVFLALVQNGADGIYAADEAYTQFALEADRSRQNSGQNDLEDSYISKVIIQPETLINSGLDARFYTDLGVQAVSLAHELTLAEIVACAKECDNLEVMISGSMTWMESRRPLISNYLDCIGKSELFEEGKLYILKEQIRQLPLPAWQDAEGTKILGDSRLEAGADVIPMHQAGIKRFRIDAGFLSNEEAEQLVDAYQAALEGKQSEVLPESTLPKKETTLFKEKTR